MKKIYQLICITSILLSCYACKHSGKESAANGNPPVYIDSLHYKNQSIYIEQIDSSDFLKLASPSFDWFDAWLLPDYGRGKPEDTTLVYYTDTLYNDPDNRVDSSAKLLTLKTQNGGEVKRLSYLSHYTERNYYVKEIKELNSYLVVFADPDDMRFSLFNKVNGHESVLKGYPVISPDGKVICCVPRECNGSANCVSFYVYSFSDETATLQWEKTDTFIGRPDLKWKDNHTLYMKINQAIETDNDKSSVQKTWYAKLTLPDFTK